MEIHFYCKLKKILLDRGISQKEFSKMSKLREATISDICNNKGISINKKHTIKIMKALGLTKLNDLIDIVVYEESIRRIVDNDSKRLQPPLPPLPPLPFKKESR